MCSKSACINYFWMNNWSRRMNYSNFSMCLIGLHICLLAYTCADVGEVFPVAREQWLVCGGEVTAAQVCWSASALGTIFRNTEFNDLCFSSCLSMRDMTAISLLLLHLKINFFPLLDYWQFLKRTVKVMSLTACCWSMESIALTWKLLGSCFL